MLSRFNFDQAQSVARLRQESERIKGIHLRTMFEDDPHRALSFRSEVLSGIKLDYSKNQIDDGVLDALEALAKEAGVGDAIQQMFTGAAINETEGRAVLHTALRSSENQPLVVGGEDIRPGIQEVLERLDAFSSSVISGAWKGHTGRSIETIVNIGIGGSDLGPCMVVESLQPFRNHLDVHFVSNVDGAHLYQTLAKCQPETTLFVVVSKTFTTQETMTNARVAREWLVDALGDEGAVSSHFVAVSTNLEGVADFGIKSEQCFGFWDWVGGRYSLWSAVGLSIALAVGFEKFRELLRGAEAMDKHFREAEFAKNLPMLLAMLGVWHNNFLGYDSHAVLPYAQNLHRFPAYLQQGDMESNGKRIDRSGKEVSWQTGPIIWGEPGTNGQHAFYQLLHQGTKVIPADFIAVVTPEHPLHDHHVKLQANCIAQTQALMMGKTADEAQAELRASGMSEDKIQSLLPFKVFPGNRPSNTLVLDRLDAYHLGMLVALYEHKIFVQGVVWGVYSFDQWGVELGKQLANGVLSARSGESSAAKIDGSTAQLMEWIYASVED